MKIQKIKPTQTTKWWALVAITATIFISSCKKEVEEKLQEPKALAETTNSGVGTEQLGLGYQEGDVVLGQQLNNPYTPDIMNTAYANVINKGITSIYPVDIRKTHYYVKFKPQTWSEYADLKEDSTLKLSDIPYDYQITQNGNGYHDPAINDSLPTYQYATVKKEFIFNDTIDYEILAYLYIPEVDSNLLGSNDQNKAFVDELLDEAYMLTGNYEDTLQDNITNTHYQPGGNIQLFDTRLNSNYGMEGVKVTARRWFVTYNANTDFNGNYRMFHDYRRPSNYSIWFEYHRFMVKSGGVHWINGPKQTGDWNHTISNGFDRFVGHIFRAAYRYHYKNIDGLQRPFRWLGNKTAYIAKDAVGTGVNPIFLNEIKIWRFRSANQEYGSDDIFSTTCHETGHTSHAIRMNTIVQFWQVSRQLQESWAVGIEWFLTHLEYASRGIGNYGESNYFPNNPPNFPNSYAFQYWSIGNPNLSGWYSPIYIDLLDNHNQLGVPYQFRGTGSINDQVSGYSLAFIESELLKHIYGHASLSQQLKNHKPVWITDAQIDILLSFF